MAFVWKLSLPWLVMLQLTGFFRYRENGAFLTALLVYAILQLVLQGWDNYTTSAEQLKTSEPSIALLGTYCLRLSDWISTILYYSVTWKTSGTVISNLKALDETFSRYGTHKDKWFIALPAVFWTVMWTIYVGFRISNWPYQDTLAQVSGLPGLRELPAVVLECLNGLLVAIFHLDPLGRITLHSFLILLAFVFGVAIHRLNEAVTKVTDHKGIAELTDECSMIWNVIKKVDRCFSTVSFLLCLNLIGFAVYDSFEMSRKLALAKSFTTCAHDIIYLSLHLLLFGTHVAVLAVLTEKSRALHTAIRSTLPEKRLIHELSGSSAISDLQPAVLTLGKLVVTRESALTGVTGILGYIMLYAESAGKGANADKCNRTNSSMET